MKFNRLVLSIAAAAATFFTPLLAHAQVEPGYTLDYSLNLKPNAGGNISYAVNNSGSIANGSFSRVAYQLTLSGSTNGNDTNGTIWVSFDTISAQANQLGVPTVGSGEFYQQAVTNMNVFSNVAGIATGTGISSGNIQFWPYDYAPNNAAGVPNASSTTFDWGDQTTFNNGYGAMNIANNSVTPTSGQMLLSYNAWGTDDATGDVGIGSQVGGSGNPNWTFANNIGDFTTANLKVWVYVPEPASFGLIGLGALGLLARRRHRAI